MSPVIVAEAARTRQGEPPAYLVDGDWWTVPELEERYGPATAARLVQAWAQAVEDAEYEAWNRRQP